MSAPIPGGFSILQDAGSEANHVVATPAHSAGDAIYLAVGVDDDLVITPPTGFAAVFSNRAVISSNKKSTAALFRKVATDSEAANYTFTTDSSERAVCVAFSVANDGGVHAQDDANEASSDEATCGAVTTTIDDCLIIRMVVTDGETLPHGTIGGYAALASAEFFSAATVSVQYKVQGAAGDSGSGVVSLGSSDEWVGFTVAIKPQSGSTLPDPDTPDPAGAAGSQILVETAPVAEHPAPTPDHLAGDAIYLAIVCNSTVTLTTPAGFEAVIDNKAVIAGDWQAAFSLYRKIAGSSEPATYTITSNSAQQATIITFAVEDDGGVAGLDDVSTGTTATASCGDVTATEDNSLVLRIVATDEVSTPHSTIAGHVMIQQGSAVGGASLSIQSIVQETAGAVGVETVSLGGAEQWLGITLIINPLAVVDETPTSTADPDSMLALVDRLRVAVRDWLKVTWSNDVLRQVLNDGVRDYSVHLPRMKIARFGTSENVLKYPLPGDFLNIYTLEYQVGSFPPLYFYRRDFRRLDFWDKASYFDILDRRDGSAVSEVWLGSQPSAGDLVELIYGAWHRHDLALEDLLTVPSYHRHILVAYGVWLCSRQLQMEEQQHPTNTSSLMMAQLSTNSDVLRRAYLALIVEARQQVWVD